MNRLLYGLPNPADIAIEMKEVREECPDCKGYGRIIYFADTGEQLSEEDFRTKDYDREIMIDGCERCEGTGYLNSYIEEPNPIY